MMYSMSYVIIDVECRKYILSLVSFEVLNMIRQRSRQNSFILFVVNALIDRRLVDENQLINSLMN